MIKYVGLNHSSTKSIRTWMVHPRIINYLIWNTVIQPSLIIWMPFVNTLLKKHSRLSASVSWSRANGVYPLVKFGWIYWSFPWHDGLTTEKVIELSYLFYSLILSTELHHLSHYPFSLPFHHLTRRNFRLYILLRSNDPLYTNKRTHTESYNLWSDSWSEENIS